MFQGPQKPTYSTTSIQQLIYIPRTDFTKLQQDQQQNLKSTLHTFYDKLQSLTTNLKQNLSKKNQEVEAMVEY